LLKVLNVGNIRKFITLLCRTKYVVAVLKFYFGAKVVDHTTLKVKM